MKDKIIQSSLEFKRRIDGITYCFHPCEPMDGQFAWKREDMNLWIIKMDRFGWVCVDDKKVIYGIHWGIACSNKDKLPPVGEWVSKKGGKSYVYDVTYINL